MAKQKTHDIGPIVLESPPPTISASVTKRPPDPPAKPPGPSFIDRNLKAGKFVLKEGAREAVVELIKLFLGLKRPPAQAPQV